MSHPAPPVADRPSYSVLGLSLFAVYLVLYGAFIYLCAFRLDWMAAKGFGGVNHATLFGFTLIFSAFVLSIIYMVAARHDREDKS